MSTEAQNEQHRQKMVELKKQQDQKRKAANESRGIVIINTGNGKGKSSSAFGTAFRAVGHGMKVGIVQFIKGTWKTGEANLFSRFPEIDHVVSGDGFTWKTQDRESDIASAERGWKIAVEMIEACRNDPPKYDLIVLDEINIALRYDYLDVQAVADVIANKPEALNIILTGRDAKPELIEIADTVTDMSLVKHAFEAGIKAQKGIEF